MTNTASIFKRAMDIAFCLAIMPLLIPLLLAISLAIRLTSPGPVFFRQRRLGRHGVPFVVLKFRTMHHGAPDIRNPDGSTYTADNDPRLTRLGRHLRKTSLDEIPQFLNVLKGDMSLVGPRPELVDQKQYYTPDELRRLAVKPGITGLAQVSGRNSLTWERRRRLDLQYVDQYSLRLDLEILLRTIPAVLFGKGIYASSSTAHATTQSELAETPTAHQDRR